MKKGYFKIICSVVFFLTALSHPLNAQNNGGNTLRVIPYTVMTETEYPVSVLTFVPDGSKLVGAENNMIVVWDAATFDESLRINEESAIRTLKMSPDSDSLLSILEDNTLIVRKLSDNRELVHFKSNSTNPVLDASFINDSNSMVLPLDGMSLSKNFILKMTGNIIPRKIAVYGSLVYSVDVNADNTMLLASVADGTVHLVDLADETETVFQGDPDLQIPAAFFPDGNTFVYAAPDHALAVKTLHGEDVFTVSVPETPSCRPVFSPDGKSFAIPTEAETIRIYDSETGRLVLTLKAPESSDGSHRILDAAFSPDGDYLFTSFENGQLIRWTLNSLFISEMADGGTSYLNQETGSGSGTGGGEWIYQLPYAPATVGQINIPGASLFLGAGYTVLLESWYPGSFDVDFCFKKRINETSLVWGLEFTGGGAMPNYRFPYAYRLDTEYGGGDLPAPWLYSFAPLAVFGYELYNGKNNRLFFDVFAGPAFRFLWDNSFRQSIVTKLYPSVVFGIAGGLDFRGFTAKVSFAYSTQVAFTASCTIGYSFRFKNKGERIYDEEVTYEEESISEAVEK